MQHYYTLAIAITNVYTFILRFESFFGMKTCLLYFLEFCPADCDWEKEMMCPGTWNEDWTEQITADYCMPYKNGDCSAYCPKQCGKEEILCPRMDPKGCPIPDTCYPAKDGCPKM